MCRQHTAPRTCQRRKHFFACGSSGARDSQPALLCVIFQNSQSHGHSLCRTRNIHCLTAFLFHLRTALRSFFFSSEREYPLQSAKWCSVWLFGRTEPDHGLFDNFLDCPVGDGTCWVSPGDKVKIDFERFGKYCWLALCHCAVWVSGTRRKSGSCPKRWGLDIRTLVDSSCDEAVDSSCDKL